METLTRNPMRQQALAIARAVRGIKEDLVKESTRTPADQVALALLELNKILKQLSDTAQKEIKSGTDGVSINNAVVKGKDLILYLSNGKQVNAGRVVGENGLDGLDGDHAPKVDETALVKRILKVLPKPKEVDEEALVSRILRMIPNDEQEEAKKIIEEIKNKKLLSYNDLKDLPNFPELVDKYTKHLANRPTPRGASALGLLTDVDLSGLNKDSNGNYILTSGGASVEVPTGSVDSVNVDFVVTAVPLWIVADNTQYFEGFGYTRVGFNITMDLAPVTFIRAIS